MRNRKTNGHLSVHAVAGSYVVLLGMDLPQARCVGLAGFAIHRTDHTENEAYYLEGMKTFEATDPGHAPGSHHSTRSQPAQSFQWADYSAKPGHDYTYTVTALVGPPDNLTPLAECRVKVRTEHPSDGLHDVYFNRGVAASQAYALRFGNRRPDEVPNNQAFVWLSRGLFEAMTQFMQPAQPQRYQFYIAAYEFHYLPFLEVVRHAVDQGSQVEIIYDARTPPSADPARPSLTDRNRAAVAAAGLTANVADERQTTKSYISHNKFILRLKDGVPEAVWTGGTNFSDGGIFGHSNVAHVVEDPAVAEKYSDYWDFLVDDPKNAVLKPQVDALTPLPPGDPPEGTTVLFSPRGSSAALDWYAEQARAAQHGLFMTFAFGMNDLWKEVYRTSAAKLRFALLESKTRSMKAGPAREAEERAIDVLRSDVANVFAIGSTINTNNQLDGWVRERLTNLNSHVKYIHNKFMLVDPLGDDPLVIAGSANFSEASTTNNDENMLVIRGNKRVADIYLGEFMRLYGHHAFRESLQWRQPDDPPNHLRTDDWWRGHFGTGARSRRRQFFA